jgi:dephospho-CoA kinase
MYIVGLTGGISSGKTTVAKMFREHYSEAVVIDLDQIGRDLVQVGKPAHKKIVKTWGTDILLEDGNIDRKKLGAKIFGSKEERLKLNSITFPYIMWEICKIVVWNWLRGTQCLILDSPLLFEAKLNRICNLVVVVYTPYETQLQRLMKRNSIEEPAAKDMINAQLSLETKKKLANVVIDNSTTLEDTQKQVGSLIQKLRICKSWISRRNVFFGVSLVVAGLAYFLKNK